MSPVPPGNPTTDEDRRLQALYALDLLDTEPEKAFDSLVLLAGQMLDCPTSMLTLVDRDRQWIKAKAGTDICETERSVAFCDYTIRGSEPMVVEAATADNRFVDNPFVTPPDGIRFYAGAPIHVIDADGDRQAIGALCVVDVKPRSMTPEHRLALKHLATLAEALIAARTAAREAVSIAESAREQARVLRRQERIVQQVERMAMIGCWRMDLDDDKITWSDGVYRIHELDPAASPDLTTALDFYPARSRAAMTGALASTIETGEPFEAELDFITAKGNKRRVRSRGEVELNQGRAVSIIGVFQDITDAHRVERSLRESASVDEVTRIANRAEFNRVLETELQAARGGAQLLLAIIDLDDFKAINDIHGHLAGDDVLRAIGQRLRAPFLKGSFAARLGGDEFALLLTDPALIADADTVIGHVLELLRTPVQSGTALLRPSGTIGSAQPGPDIETARELMHAADVALYTAKRARRGTAHAYAPARAANG